MRVGVDVLVDQGCDLLRGKRVALLSHQAAMTASGATSAQLLYRELGTQLVALFGPEHGFGGHAAPGESTHSHTHPDWGIPVHALYGKHQRPTPEMLDGVDLLICDLQDLGVRCYTYLATLREVLEACCGTDISVVVTDRPIPLPSVTDGPMLKPEFSSFVAPARVPLVYGMTPAEAARWLVADLELDLQLHTIPMQGWQRSSTGWGANFPPFIPPSPGIKGWESAACFAATVFTEALVGVDCGRSTNLAFRLLGAPWLKGEEFCAALAEHSPDGVACWPYRYIPSSGIYAGQELAGALLTILNPAAVRPAQLSLEIIATMTQLYGSETVWHHQGMRHEWFDKLYGCNSTRLAMMDGSPVTDIVAGWQTGLEDFNASRATALLYS